MIPLSEYEIRRNKIQNTIKNDNLDAFIISDSNSIYYYTGASYKAQERPFFIIIFPDENPTFVVPKLEESHMQKANIGKVVAYWEYPAPVDRGWPTMVEKCIKDLNNIGVEPSISLENYNKLCNLKSLSKSVIKSYPFVEYQRLVKTPVEIEMIRQAAAYADMGMDMMLSSAYYGVSVLEMFSIGRKVQLEVIKTGEYEPLQTEFLTATWPAPHSAKPHGIPPINGKLRDGPLAAMSYLKINGYAAECERTFCLKHPSQKHIEIFNVVEKAREKAFQMVKPGVKAADVDNAAMDYLKEASYGKYLLHRTGHGIGQGNHEGPWVAEGSEHILKENMVISVEPGIYIPDFGGLRHSDTVLVTKNGYECLTKYPTDLESLTITKSNIISKIKGKIVQKAMKMDSWKV